MLSLLDSNIRLCDGVTRRESLRIGGLGFTGLLMPRSRPERAMLLSRGPRGAGLSTSDDRYPKYPRQPVVNCDRYQT